VDVDAAADELYGLPPRDFTARRDALAKQARAEGDRTTAVEIGAMRRPTVVAWLANQLARRHPDEVGPLVELGAALREATATLSGPELRALSTQRRQLVHALVRQARTLGQADGQRVTDDVERRLEETLTAALADPAAARLLVAARLTDGMTHQGYVGQDPPGAPRARPDPDASPDASPDAGPSADDRRTAEQKAALERELDAAAAAERAASDAREAAGVEADRAQRERTEAEREVTRLRAELGAAEAALESAGREHDQALATRDRTELEVESAGHRVRELRARLDIL